MGKDKYMCQLCQNHGIFDVPKKGHKQLCPYKNCSCSSCSLNAKRRELDQIERQLRKDDPSDVRPSDASAPQAAIHSPEIHNNFNHAGDQSCFSPAKTATAASFDLTAVRPTQHFMNSPTLTGSAPFQPNRDHPTQLSLEGTLSSASPFLTRNGNAERISMIRPNHAMLPVVPAACIQRTNRHSVLRYCPYNMPRLENFCRWNSGLPPSLSQAEPKVQPSTHFSISAFQEVLKMSASGHVRPPRCPRTAVKQQQPSIFRSAELMAKQSD